MYLYFEPFRMLVHGSFYTAETRLRPLDLSADERPRYSWTDSRTLIMFIIIIISNGPHYHNHEDDKCPDPPEEDLRNAYCRTLKSE